MKNSFRPCNTCSLLYKNAKGQAPKDKTAIAREVEKEKIKAKWCPYK